MSLLVALLLAQVSPALKVQADEFGECSLYGWGRAQLPSCILPEGLIVPPASVSLWFSGNSGSTPPAITGSGIAPDGSAGADQLTFPAVTAGSGTWFGRSPGYVAGAATVSIYIKGIDLFAVDLCVDRAGATCTHCFLTAEWSRCSVTRAEGVQNLYVGNMGLAGYHFADHAGGTIQVYGLTANAGTVPVPYCSIPPVFK